MPNELVFDPWTLAFLLALFALLGALCAYLGAKVFDQSEFMSHQLFEIYRLGWNSRLGHLENWKKRFIAHHNRDHAAADGGRADRVATQNALNAVRAALNAMHPVVERHDAAINGLVAANGEFNGLKAFVGAIETVQAKQEDRLAKIERDDAEKVAAIEAWGNLHDRLEAIEFRLGGKEGMAAIERASAKAKRKR